MNQLQRSPIGARPSTGTRKPEGVVRHESGPRQARCRWENQIIISFHSAANNSYFCPFRQFASPSYDRHRSLFISAALPSSPSPVLFQVFSLWFSPNFLPPFSVPDSPPLSLHSRGSPASFPWLPSLPNFVAFILFFFFFYHFLKKRKEKKKDF